MTIAIDADFPREYARTDRFRRGLPRTFEVTDQHVTFLRSSGPRDARLSLWRLHLESGSEECLVDAESLHADDTDLPPAERARRERLRESGAGITGYSQSASGDRIAFAVGGVLWLWDAFGLRSIPTPGPVFDPRLDRAGASVACVVDGSLLVLSFTDGEPVLAVAEAAATVGLADFAAAEELGRQRGHWWSPGGDMVIAEVVDERPVPLWHISDPTHPERAPQPHRYPHAGAANAHCSLLVVDVPAGTQRTITWDAADYEYLVSVQWTPLGPPLVTLADRAQTRMTTFILDPVSGTLEPRLDLRGEPWLEVSPGAPTWLADGRLAHLVDDHETDTRRLAADGAFLTEPGFQVTSVVAAGEQGVVVTGAVDPRTPTARHIAPDGSSTPLSDGFTYCAFTGSDAVQVRITLHGDRDGRDIEVLRAGAPIAQIGNLAEHSDIPAPQFLQLGERGLHAVVLWPREAHSEPLPVVLSPYGGPHHLEVVAAAGSFAEDQWLADQGFCVVIADGRGTPGRGLAWEHAIANRFAEITLADQVAALDAVLERFPDRLDGSRVGIRGWSYGGYLSALALLARPDRFHVGIAGAPVTDWRLYDTTYTERYLGHPDAQPQVYADNSLLHLAPNLRGRLLIVHGLADDNVVSAHSLQLSAALLSAGRPHDFLPLAGVSHMTPQEAVTEHLMRLQADYLREHLQ